MVHHTNWLRASFFGPLVKRLRQRPLTPLTWVRIPLGSPKKRLTRESSGGIIMNVLGQKPEDR